MNPYLCGPEEWIPGIPSTGLDLDVLDALRLPLEPLSELVVEEAISVFPAPLGANIVSS